MNFEKVNPNHPDKIADRIAGAMVDLAYSKQENPKVAVEVLIGHGKCHIIAESSYEFTKKEVQEIVNRIADVECKLDLVVVPQDEHLANNQAKELRCGDNGIFKGVPTSDKEKTLAEIAYKLYNRFPYDGKYIIKDNEDLIICQSNATEDEIRKDYQNAVINPLGYWTGGVNVDSGATNRKLGSDMGRAVTGGGLHGKDLSKADVSVNIVCHMLAQQCSGEVEATCAIGDETVKFVIKRKLMKNIKLEYCYNDIVHKAKQYIESIGGFEQLACWGLIR